MERNTIYWKEQGVTAQLSHFESQQAQEMHVMLRVEPRGELFSGQLERMSQALQLLATQYPSFKCVLKRYFLSDSTNQAQFLPKEPKCAISLIQQSPLDGSKLAVWCYLVSDIHVENHDGTICFTHNGYTHYWDTTLCCPSGDSSHQTKEILVRYEKRLAEEEMNLDHNCLRTWFFIRDVDTQYAGMVKARRENFTEQGLTEKTHYIASTGIEGNPAHPSALVQMDAYALKGLKNNQFSHLYASTHLNPTYEYGVTFERGTKISYGDRAHLLISGTASIDHKGEVLNVGDVRQQTLRMWENVEMLLKEGGATYDAVAQMIVYLRDAADYQMVKQLFTERFPNHPVVITLAPVCRPTWLIEMECLAIVAKENKNYLDF